MDDAILDGDGIKYRASSGGVHHLTAERWTAHDRTVAGGASMGEVGIVTMAT